MNTTALLLFLVAFGAMIFLHWFLKHHIHGKTAKQIVLSVDMTAFLCFLAGYVMKEVLELKNAVGSSIVAGVDSPTFQVNYTGMIFLMVILAVSVLLYKLT